MSEHLVFTRRQFEVGLAEVAATYFHGGFIARREIGDPVLTVDHLPTLAALGARMVADSKAWFPSVHQRGRKATATHYALGLAGEVGEVLDVIKKADICGWVSECELHAGGKHDADALASELADALTYLLALASRLGVDLDAAYAAKRQVNIERWGDPSARDGAS